MRRREKRLSRKFVELYLLCIVLYFVGLQTRLKARDSCCNRDDDDEMNDNCIQSVGFCFLEYETCDTLCGANVIFKKA